jgi:hypothetical protein
MLHHHSNKCKELVAERATGYFNGRESTYQKEEQDLLKAPITTDSLEEVQHLEH